MRGWVSNTNLARGLGDAALVLDNGYPTATGLRIRGGRDEYYDTTEGAPIKTMFTYSAEGVQEFFAANDAKIWNMTSTPAVVVTGQTDGEYSIQQMETSGGEYLYAVNGTDSPLLYDGSSWSVITAASSPVSITGVTSADLGI